MLNLTDQAQPAAARLLPWAHLDIPQRMQRVIERVRLIGGDDRVAFEDFRREPETCELTRAELDANVGKASILIAKGAVEPTYSREQRILAGAALLSDLLPSVDDMKGRLALYSFTPAEIADLLPDLGKRLALSLDDRFQTIDDAMPAHPQMWGRDVLERSAH